MACAPDTQRMREFIFALMELPAAGAILDLGCGRGHDLRQIGMRVGSRATLVGIDHRQQALDAARQEIGDDPRMTLRCADLADGIPYPDGTFDLVYSINLLECLPDKPRHLQEMHRVLKPGGQVVCAHFDWDSQLFDGADTALVRKIVQTYNDWQQPWMADCDAWMGRRLWRTFQRSGLFTGTVHPYVLVNTRFTPPYYGHARAQDFQALVSRGMLSREEYGAFYGALAALAEQDAYFYSITLYAYAGRTGGS